MFDCNHTFLILYFFTGGLFTSKLLFVGDKDLGSIAGSFCSTVKSPIDLLIFVLKFVSLSYLSMIKFILFLSAFAKALVFPILLVQLGLRNI